MASKDLTTGWKRIGRSGPTVDGRVIKPEMIDQAAASYDKALFTALIWPEHQRFINLGTVEELRAADNSEGGRDLYAIIAPNEWYISSNKAGQKLFTSMELKPDFRKTGEWYLTGLGATDDPASAATEEIRLSAAAKPDVFVGAAVAHEEHTFHDHPKPNFLEKLATSFFKKTTFEDEDMADKAEIEKLKSDMEALTAKFAALKPAAVAATPAAVTTEEAAEEARFAAFVDKITAAAAARMEAKFAALEAAAKAAPAAAASPEASADDKFKALQAELKALQEKFAAAMKEQPGTQAGEHFGSGEKPEDYL